MTAKVGRWTRRNIIEGDPAGTDSLETGPDFAPQGECCPQQTRRTWRTARASSRSLVEHKPECRTADAAHEIGLDACLKLRCGTRMPCFGLGTWQSRSGECRRAVLEALRAGYRLVDTAQVYGNEADVGAALRESGINRSEVFMVTKLASRQHGRENVAAALQESLGKLGLDYVDLFLIHSPRGGHVLETWDALLSLRDAGLARSVGVSNFGADQLRALRAAGREMPAVNQIELHCFWQQRETVTFCEAEGIQLMAYSPLARGQLLDSDELKIVADDAHRTQAEVCIRWAVQRGFIVIPKSITPSRIRANAAALRGQGLSEGQMDAIFGLERGLCTCPAASSMQLPWADVAERAPPRGKGSAKGKGKSPGSEEASGRPLVLRKGQSWAEACTS